MRAGEEHPGWKGDAASPRAKRRRATKIYALGDCERCALPATERHHKDKNTGNNLKSNIMILCRRCHMVEDGRLEKLRALEHKGAPPKHTHCIICNKEYRPMRKGRCNSCDNYLRAYGTDKPKNYSFNPTNNLGIYAIPAHRRTA